MSAQGSDSNKISEELDAQIPIQHLTRLESIDSNSPPVYVASYNYIVETAKRIFGPENINIEILWDKVLHESVESSGDDKEEHVVIVLVCVRAQLATGAYHEDIAVGEGRDEEKYHAFQKARERAKYSSTKRALKSFGNALGCSLNDADLRAAYHEAEQIMSRR